MTPELLTRLPLRDAASHHLLEHPEGSALYPAGALTSGEAAEKRARQLAAWPGNRKALGAWLAEQNGFAPLHAAQERNLEAASRPDSLFVLTGQQPGLLGGPALRFCKAMTCVAWAKSSAERLGRPVIPVFWVAGDDSDLAECNALEWLEPHAPASSFSLDFSDPLASIPMSLRMLSREGLGELFNILRGVWDKDVTAWAESACKPEHSLTTAFMLLAQKVLGPEGVLFVDGIAAAKRAQPLLQRIVREAPAFHAAVGKGSARLAQVLSLPPQVPLRHGAVPVFMLEDSQRTRLFFSDTSVRIYAQGAEGHDVLPELENRVLLHSALTRPLVAEEVFPVLGHILGPAELRYFAQISEVFPAFGKTFPLLASRQQMLACSRGDWERLASLGISPEDLPGFGPSRLRARLAEKIWEKHPAAEAFPDAAFKDFSGELKRYQSDALPRSGNLDAALRRLESAFGRYREAARQTVFAAEASELYASFLPLLRWLGNGSQDRHLNLLSLRNVLGPDGFESMTEMLRNAEAATSVVLYD